MPNSQVASCSKDSEPLPNQTSIIISQKYQISFLKLLFIRGYVKQLEKFEIESNVEDVDEFCDVIFDEGGYSNYFMKFKCFDPAQKNKVSAVDLLDAENGEYSLLKLICAYKKMKTQGRFKDAFIRSLIVFTNLPLDFEKDTNFLIDDQSQGKIDFKELPIGKKDFLHMKTDNFEVKCFRTIDQKIVEKLNDQARELSSGTQKNQLQDILKSLTEKDIKDGLKILKFVVLQNDVDEFQKTVEQQIKTEIKSQLSNCTLGNLDEIVCDSLYKNQVLAYSHAKSFVEKNIKMGILDGLHGLMYAVAVTMLLFTRAYFYKMKSFRLETEAEKASKFDDIVYSTKTKNNPLEYRFIQLKHKQNDNSKLKCTDIFDDLKGNFSLIKYVCSFWVIKNNPAYNQCLIKDTIVFTNSSFCSDKKIVLNIDKGTSNNPKKSIIADIIYTIIIVITEVLQKIVFYFSNLKSTNPEDNKPKIVRTKSDKDYETWFKDISEIGLEKFSFDENDILNFPNVKYFKFADPNVVEILLRQKKTFENSHTEKEIKEALSTLDEKSIEEALNHIVFAVNQPNENKIFEMVENEMKEYFKLHSVETTFFKLKNNLIDWSKGKPIFSPKIAYSEIDIFFQNNSKKFHFEIPLTTKTFVGRKTELEKVRKTLNLKSTLAISQSISNTVGISGLGGIGKSELAKQFIERFKDSDYFGRIVWIDAENQSSIKTKIDCIISDLKINMPDQTSLNEDEKTKQKIRLILDFFTDMKILYVFDNVEKTDQTFDCLTYFREIINTMSNKPHILITTRNSSFGGKHISHINLNVLSEDDAVEMVRRHLVNFVMNDEEANQLVNLLQFFPLAIKQATAYILNENEAAKTIGSQYTITQYIEAYNKKAEELLDFPFEDDFGNEYSQTTFTTWNVTIDAFSKHKHGKDAIRILEYIAYFNADKIDFKFLVPLLHDPKNSGHAIKLLKRFSLINENKLCHEKTPIYNIHRLVQKVTSINNKNNEKEIQILHELLGLISKDRNFQYSNISADNFDQILIFAFKHDSLIKSWYQHNFPSYVHSESLWKMIHFAARLNICSVIDSILKIDEKFNLNISTEDKYKYSPLHISTRYDNTNFVKRLIENKVSLNYEDGYYSTPLQVSIKRNNVAIVKLLIGQGAKIDVHRRFDETLLHVACENGNLEMVKYLNDKGLALNAVTEYNGTSLHFASESGNLELVKYLVKKCVKLNVVNSYDETAFTAAIEKGHLEIVKYLAEEVDSYDFIGKDGSKALEVVILSGRFEVLKYLVEKHFLLNAVNEKGQTLLHLASESKSLEIVKYLVDKGISIDSVDNEGQTVLHFASQSYILEILKYFVEKGIALDVVNNKGQTAFHIAIRSNRLHAAEYLINKGADLNAVDNEGSTALHMACAVGNLETMKYLVDKRINLIATNNLGENALYVAANNCWNEYKIIKYLFDQNNALNSVDNLFRTALDIAFRKDNRRVIALLLSLQKKEKGY